MDIKDLKVSVKINEEFMAGFNFAIKVMQTNIDGLHYSDEGREKILGSILDYVEIDGGK